MKVSPGELVFDCWQARTADLEALKADGFVGAIRYIDGWWPGSSFGKVDRYDKSCGPEEVAKFAAAGMGLLLVWQTTAGFALNGAQQGDQHGRQAAEQMTALGYPADRHVVFFAVDTDISRAQHAAVEAYARAFQRWVPKVGCYGEVDLLDHLHSVGAIESGWLPGAASWSDYRTTPNADVTQLVGSPVVGGILIDRNWVNNPMDFWLPGETAAQEEDDDMGMLWQDAESGTLWHIVGNTRSKVVSTRGSWAEVEADIAALVAKGLLKMHETPQGRATFLTMPKEQLGFFAPAGEMALGAGSPSRPLNITLTGVATP